MTTRHTCWSPRRNQTCPADTSADLCGVFFFLFFCEGGSEETGSGEGGREEAADEKVGGIKEDRRERGRWGAGWTGEEEEGEGQTERERRDSQSMKLFDNLVIYFLQSIPPEELAIKGDTQWQRNKETLSGGWNAETKHSSIHTTRHTTTPTPTHKKHTIIWLWKTFLIINQTEIIHEFCQVKVK